MLNKVLLIGNLGRDPEYRTTATGTSVCNLSLATTEKYNGESKTEWHKLVSFGKTADNLARYTKKGSKLYIEGQLQTRSWDGKDGNKQYSTEIVVREFQFLDSKPDRSTDNQQSHTPQEPDHSVTDEDIPW